MTWKGFGSGAAVNRRGLVSFHDRDHFDGGPVKQEVLRLAGDPRIERVLCLTQLRVLGYVFNPVSFYWCYRGDGTLSCVVAELNNTFGERLPEVLATHFPVCWDCHIVESVVREHADRVVVRPPHRGPGIPGPLPSESDRNHEAKAG